MYDPSWALQPIGHRKSVDARTELFDFSFGSAKKKKPAPKRAAALSLSPIKSRARSSAKSTPKAPATSSVKPLPKSAAVSSAKSLPASAASSSGKSSTTLSAKSSGKSSIRSSATGRANNASKEPKGRNTRKRPNSAEDRKDETIVTPVRTLAQRNRKKPKRYASDDEDNAKEKATTLKDSQAPTTPANSGLPSPKVNGQLPTTSKNAELSTALETEELSSEPQHSELPPIPDNLALLPGPRPSSDSDQQAQSTGRLSPTTTSGEVNGQNGIENGIENGIQLVQLEDDEELEPQPCDSNTGSSTRKANGISLTKAEFRSGAFGNSSQSSQGQSNEINNLSSISPFKSTNSEADRSETSSGDSEDEYDAEFLIEEKADDYMTLQNSEKTHNVLIVPTAMTKSCAGFLQPVFSDATADQEYPGVLKTKMLILNACVGIGYIKINPRTVRPPETCDIGKLIIWVVEGKVTIKSAGGFYQSPQTPHAKFLFPKVLTRGMSVVIPKNAVYTFENWSNNDVILSYCLAEENSLGTANPNLTLTNGAAQ